MAKRKPNENEIPAETEAIRRRKKKAVAKRMSKSKPMSAAKRKAHAKMDAEHEKSLPPKGSIGRNLLESFTTVSGLGEWLIGRGCAAVWEMRADLEYVIQDCQSALDELSDKDKYPDEDAKLSAPA